MAHRSMVRRSGATVVSSPLLKFFRRHTCGPRNQIRGRGPDELIRVNLWLALASDAYS